MRKLTFPWNIPFALIILTCISLYFIIALVMPAGGEEGSGSEKSQVDIIINKCKEVKKCSLERLSDDSEEKERIRCWVNCIAREPSDQEKRMYTWSYVNSTINMLSTPKNNYYHSLYAQRKKFEEVCFRLANFSKYKIKKNKLKGVIKTAAYYEELFNLKFIDDIVNRLDLSTARNQEQLIAIRNLLILDHIYPGFKDNVQKTPESELKELQKEYKKSCDDSSSIMCSKLMGQIKGIEFALMKYNRSDKSSFSYNGDSSMGNGIYMAENIVQFIEHFEGAGLSCTTTGKIIDISKYNFNREYDPYTPGSQLYLENKKGIQNYEVLYRAGIIYKPQEVCRGISTCSKNMLTSPVLFEQVTEGMIVRFNSGMGIAHVNKKAINMKSSCRYITINDFKNCHQFDKMKRTFKTGLPAFLVRFNNDAGFKYLTELIGKCGEKTVSNKKCANVKTLFNGKSTDDTSIKLFRSEYNDKFDPLLKECKCKDEDGKVQCP